MIPALVQEILVALIVGASVLALASRFVRSGGRVRKCPACASTRRPAGRGIRAKGLDVLS